jgi:2-keto-3-deoxy-L-rhamnonate aldolase RhmA
MKAAIQLKDKVARGEITTGALATDHLFPELVEYLQRAGFDYLIIDREHGAHGDELVASVCALGRMTDFPVLLRPPNCDYTTIRQSIDRGPCGFLLPSVESVADLDQVRDSIYMPPRGKRRPGGAGNYWVSDFNYESFKREVEDHFIVLPQIETRQGLDRVDDIAAHEITTAIAIGPYDLSMELGVGNQMDHPRMQEAVETIHQAGEKAGKTMWRIGDGAKLVADGFHFLCIAEPMGVLQAALAQMNQSAKDAAPA